MQKKNGFTLFEVILMIIIISVGIIAIIISLSNGITFIQKTREKTIAINLAREGIEAVYQIRDTNWKRRGGKKESCRLKKDPSRDTNGSATDCADDTWISTGYYFLTTTTMSGQQYFALSGGYVTGINLTDGIVDASDQNFALCQNTGNNSRYACTSQSSIEGQFFRQIRGLGLFRKDSSIVGGSGINCINGSTSACNNDLAKEYRFCSEVHYMGHGQGNVTLCGVLTNFQKQ